MSQVDRLFDSRILVDGTPVTILSVVIAEDHTTFYCASPPRPPRRLPFLLGTLVAFILFVYGLWSL